MTFIRHAFMLLGVLATQAACVGFVTAAERPAVAAATVPNAAVIYWQAFALLPQPLAEPQKAKLEAAVSNPAAPVADDLKPIVMSLENSLAALHRAARVARVLSGYFLPAAAGFCERMDEAHVRRQLLLLAIKAKRQGTDAVRGSTIPGHGPVEYRVTDTGFELRCQPGSTDKPVVLQVSVPRS